jgi:hypothetical protein
MQHLSQEFECDGALAVDDWSEIVWGYQRSPSCLLNFRTSLLPAFNRWIALDHVAYALCKSLHLARIRYTPQQRQPQSQAS